MEYQTSHLNNTTANDVGNYGNTTINNNGDRSDYNVYEFQVNATHTTAKMNDQQQRWDIYDTAYTTEASLVIFVNVSLMLILLTNQRVRRKPSIRCFVSLQLTHVFLGLVSIIDSTDKSDESGEREFFYMLISNGLLVEGFFSMLLQTLEKLVMIHFPFKHQNMVKKRWFEILIVITWFLSAIVPIFFSFFKNKANNNEITYVLTGTVSTSFVILIFSNILVVKTARRHCHAIQKTMVGNNPDSVARRRCKSMITCLAITLTYVLLWLPYLVHNILILRKSYILTDQLSGFTFSVVFVGMLNGIADPIILMLSNRDVKKLVRKTTSIRNRDNYVKQFKSMEKNNDGSSSTLSSVSSMTSVF